MDILGEIQNSWSWIGLNPKVIVTENDFGNVIVKDSQDVFWRICPEELDCEVIANSIEEYNVLIKDKEFVEDWFMQALVDKAKEVHGNLPDGQKYCFAIPAALGGEYAVSNIKTVSFAKLVRFSGDMGKQIRDLPDGAEVELKWID